MGDPKKSPWDASPEQPTGGSPWERRPQTATRDKPETGRQPEKKEAPAGQKGGSIDDYKKKAEKLSSDPNVKAAEAIRELKGNKETVAQLDGLTALNTAIVSVLTKLAKKGVDVSKIRTVKDLQREILKNGIILTLPEAAAVENLDRIAGQPGPTATEVKNSWPDRVQTAQEASKGWSHKYKEYLQKDPVGTIALTIAGAAGIYLTYQGIKSLVKMAFADEDADKSKEKGGSWFKKEIMIPLVIMAAAGILGKDVVKKICKDAGLDWFDVEDKLRRGEELTEDQKNKAKKAAKKVQDEIDAKRKGATAAGGAAAAGPEAAEEYEEPAPVPGALEVEGEALRESGEMLLRENGAEKLDDGAFLIATGKRNVFYKFDTDAKKWMWQSETQRKNEEWVDCGTSHYDEKVCPDAVKANEIARELAEGREGGAAEKKEWTAKVPISPETKFRIAEELFINVFFFEHSFKTRSKKNELRYALGIIRDKKIKLSQISAVVEKYKEKKRIPKAEFPEITQDLTDAQLFMLMHKLVSFSKLAEKLDGDPTIDTIFIAVANKPSYQANRIFHSNIIEKLKSGDFLDALVGMDYEKMNQEVIQKIKDGSIQIVEAINQKMDPALRDRFNKLSETEKKHVYEIQGVLIAEANIRIPAEQAVTEAIRDAGNKVTDPNTKQFLIDFFETVKRKTQEVLPKAKKRYSFTTVNGNPVNDTMESGVQFEKLSFLHAVEIVVATDGMDLDQEMKVGEEQYMQDMALLTILLRAMNEQDRRRYLAHLGTKVVDQDFDIRIPGLENLRPYFSSLAELGKGVVAEYGLKYLTTAITYADARPEMGSKEFKEKLKNSPIMSFGREGVGGTVEIGRDALAFLVSFCGIKPESFSNVETGEEFINLLMSNQNTQEVVYSKHTSLMAIQIAGKWIVIKPLGIIKETLSELANLDLSAAGKTVLIGSAPFMMMGGAKEAYLTLARVNKAGVVRRSLPTKIVNILGGFAKGAKYPLIPFTLTKRGIEAAFHSAQICESYVRSGRQVFNWTTDIFRVRTLHQNIGNMLESGKWMSYYRSQAKDLSTRTWRDVLFDLKTDRTNLVKRAIFSDFNKNMAVREAIRFSKQYNAFFEFGKGSDKTLHLRPLKDMENLSETISGADRAYLRMKLFCDNAEKSSEVLGAMQELTKKGLSKEELLTQIAEQIRKIQGLEEHEISALAKQMREEGDVTKLMTRLKAGVNYFNRKLKAVPTPEPKGAPKGAPVRILGKELKYQYGGEFIELTKDEISAMRKAKNLTQEEAIAALCEEKWLAKHPEAATAVEAAGGEGAPEPAKPVTEPQTPERIGDTNKYRYKGGEYEANPKEVARVKTARNLKSDSEAIEAICEQKWNSRIPLERTPDGGHVIEYRGRKITLTAGEFDNRLMASSQAKYDALVAAEQPAGGTEGARARLRRGWQHFKGETLHSAGGSEAVLKETAGIMEKWQTRITKAEKVVQDMADARAAGKDLGDASKAQKQLDKARRVIAQGKAVKVELEATAKAVQAVKTTQEALKAAEAAKDVARIAALQKELRAGTLAAEEAMKSSGKALEAVSQFGKVGTAFKTGVRFAGGGLAIVGTGVSAYLAVYSFGEAWSTEVEGRKGLKYGESAMWAGSAVIDSLAVAGMLGVEGTAVGVGSAVALPLAPVIYAGSKVFETLDEDTRTSAEWIQGDPYQLLQHFYTSMNSCALGDAWISVWSQGNAEWRIEKQKVTMRRIFRALIALQKDKGQNPPLRNYLFGKEYKDVDQKEKDRVIEERIKANYSRYHEFYFNQAMISGVQSYGDAQRFILEAQMFDDIMQKRDEARKMGKTFTIVGNDKRYPFNLHLEQYDITDDGKINPETGRQYSPANVVRAYKETMVNLFESDPVRKLNLDRMDNGYLLMIFMQIAATLKDSAMKEQLEADKGLAEDLGRQAMSIELYLETARGMNMKFAGEYSKPEPRWSLKEIEDHLNGIGSATNETFLKYEKKEYQMTPAQHALYKLAEYFGYAGPPKETRLKEFFKKDAASYHGLYWDGSEWMLQERGMEFDDSFGPELSTSMIEKIIVRMREQPDNVLEHRNDAIFMDAHDYRDEVMKMAKVLEDGLAVGIQRGYKSDRKESAIEKGAHVEYTQPKEDLTQNYKKAIEYIIGKTDWNKLDYTINNEKSITLKRKDGDATTEITRTGEAWKVGPGYRGGLTLMQAVTLGNLVNWAKQWVKKENIEGGSERPFEIDGDVIDFDVSGSPVDRDFLKGWIGFYGEIGISKEMAVETLNNWFFNDIRKRSIDVGFFEG
ncbi:MAG: hypothetical protein V1880_02540 [Patescibacteria group bacterium]